MKKHYTIPVFVPELACPHRCVFCNQNHITSYDHSPSIEEAKAIIEERLSTIPDESIIEIGYFGGSFTGIPPEEQESFLELARRYKQQGVIQGIRLSTRPDYISKAVLDRLGAYGVTTIELGIQSMDDDVLRRSGRGHTAGDTEIASEMIVNRGFRLGLQMMPGLPGDNEKKSIHTARRIVELGASSARIYPTLVVRDTPLEMLWLDGKYQPLAMEQAIERTKNIVSVFEQNKVRVIRIGLHPSEGFLNGSRLRAGPFHQSFRELVMTEVWNEKFQNHKWRYDEKQVKIFVHPGDYNVAVGYRAKNKKELLNTFHKVKFLGDKNITKGTFYVDYS
ncbi:MAG: radical SAM protein [Bacteroidales bacterium]|nr:radical SAM protein [Bacteroidales bacterium]MCF8337856.1 radical SAM protein [Bacteroidales bacterium]